ncbi:unnamed protein product [Phaedon cochleariae]|uniref:Uncharacterized protein n=1 Tax=Phaedon cochleariae TaxID=80249 RepID=A0A9N9SJE4_PHACE|nr:unnamed protein product [Phaedon cochleariae]
MASNYLLLLVIICCISKSFQNTKDNTIDDSSPYEEVASDIRKEQNGQNFGALFTNFMETEGANIMGDALSNFGKENAGQLLQGLGSLLAANAKQEKETQKNFPARLTRRVEASHPFVVTLETCRTSLSKDLFIQRTARLWNTLPREVFPEADNLQKFKKNKNSYPDAPNVLEGIGALMGALGGANQGGAGGNDAGALLQGLGSLLGNKEGQGGLDPAVIGNMLNMFVQSQGDSKTGTKSKDSKTKNPKKAEKSRSDQPDFDIGDLLSLASNFIGQPQTGKKGLRIERVSLSLHKIILGEGVWAESSTICFGRYRLGNIVEEYSSTLASLNVTGKDKNGGQEGNFMSYLPMIMQLINSFTGPEAESRAKSHESHSWLLPPFLEKLHVVFDHFINSDIGKQIIAALGAEKTFKVFLDEQGKFSYQKFGEMMENHSFRRHWIRLLTDRIAGFLVYVSHPTVYKSYLATGQIFLNGYLKSQGFPKAALFDPAKPVETISALVNHIAKTYFDVRIKSKEYVKPAVIYVKDLLKLLEKNGPIQSSGSHNEFTDKLTDTINLEIIEPLARVNRAYRFAKSVPKCDRYVLCLVNEDNQNEVKSLPGLKNLLYKGSSLLAAWFLSEETKTAFWTYYTDIMDETNCKALYNEKCNDFHVEELRVTTEYVHNEL